MHMRTNGFIDKRSLVDDFWVELSCEHEFEADTEILCRDRIGRGGEQRFVHLPVVVCRECQEFAQGIVGGEGYLHGFVAAGGL